MRKILITFILLLSSIILYWWWVYARETILSNDISIKNIDNDPYKFKIIISGSSINKNDFEYYKISHSTTNPDIIYPDWFIWYSQDVNNNFTNNSNFSNYYPDINWWKNYYRACFVTSKNFICSKTSYEISFKKQEIDEDLLNNFLKENFKTISLIKNNEYLKQKLQSYTSLNIDDIKNSLPNVTKEKFQKLKDFVSLLSKDIWVKEIISSINNLEEVSKNIEIINNSLSKFWNYWLNNDLLNELNIIKTKLNNKLISNQNQASQDLYKRSISDSLIKSSQLLSLVDFSFSKKMESEISSLKNEKISTWSLNRLASMKENLEEEIIKNEKILALTWITSSDKKKLLEEIDKLKSSSWEIDKLLLEIESLEKQNNKISHFNMKLILLVFLLLLFIIFLIFIIFRWRRNKTKLVSDTNYKVLQILKNWNEYSIEYDWVYNKWVKVLENTKKSIKSSIQNFVNSSNLFSKTRWVLEELEEMNIEIPDLVSSWNTIFKLFIWDSIKDKLFNQNQSLIIKTDEQEIPWEIMHNWENFLSLKIPISRQIMTRELIRTNKSQKNKVPNMLFIINPTLDLDGTQHESEEIIKKITWKVNIRILKWKTANIQNVINEISKNNYDIIHYSWHTFFNAEKPDESWLLLYENEVLSNSEIKRLIWWNPLIFLNSCSSWEWISDNDDYFQKTWEDTIWLATSFLIWWAKWVISTLWPINDKTAWFFAIEFYLKLLQKESLWKSLLYAKKETYIQNPKDPTWASFIYFWDPNLKINLK